MCDLLNSVSSCKTIIESNPTGSGDLVVLQALSFTEELMPIREQSLQDLRNLNDGKGITQDNKVPWISERLSFEVARHLVLTSYLGTTWSIYDRLTDICMKLVFQVNQGINWKISTVFNENSKTKMRLKFLEQLETDYLQAIDFSYNLRNWVLHEGAPNNKPLFENLTELRLSDSAIKSMQMKMKDFDKIEDQLWQKGCVLDLLEFCNSQIDEMFTKLLNWSTMVAYPEQFVSRNPNGTI